MPKALPQGLAKWGDTGRLFLGGHIISNPEEFYEQYGKVNIASLPAAETGGRSASDMAFQDIEKMEANKARDRMIQEKYSALESKFNGQIPTSEYEKVFPRGFENDPNWGGLSVDWSGGSPNVPQAGAQPQSGTTAGGERIDESDPRVQALIKQGLNPDVAIGNVLMSLKGGQAPPAEPAGIISSTAITPEQDYIKTSKDYQKTLQGIIGQLPQIQTPTVVPFDQNAAQPSFDTQNTVLQQTESALKERQDVLGENLLRRKGEINKAVEEEQRRLVQSQFQQKELTRAKLAHIGISDINSTQAIQYLNDLQNEHNATLTQLFNHKQLLISQAEQSFNDGNFDLTSKWIDELKDAQNRQDDLIKFKTQNQLKIIDLSMRQQEFQIKTGLDYANLSLNETKIALDAIGEENRSQEANARIALDAIKEERANKALIEEEREFEREFEEDKRQFGLEYALKQRELDIKQKETGTSGLSISERTAQREAMSGYLGQVISYTSRDEALADLSKYQTKIINDVGQAGFDSIKAEVDRLFPAILPAQDTEAGKAIDSIFISLFK